MEQLPIQPEFSSNISDGSPFPDWEKYDPTTHAIADYLNVKMSDPVEYREYKDKVKFIKEWAYEMSKSTNKTDLLSMIAQAERKVGLPPFGEKRVAHLYKYIRLDMDRIRIKQQQTMLKDQAKLPIVPPSKGLTIIPKPLVAQPANTESKVAYETNTRGLNTNLGKVSLPKPKSLI